MTKLSKHLSALKGLKRVQTDQERERIILANVPGLGNFEFEIHRRDDRYISDSLARYGIWEPFETEVFCHVCRRGDFVLDIGANIGWYSVVASKIVGERGRILSFEPDPDNFKILSRNINRSHGALAIEIKNIAIGDQINIAKLFLSQDNLGDHHLFHDGTECGFLDVRVQTLDSIFAGADRLPTLVKSDTQGFEARILSGSAQLIKNGWRPIWLLEFWPYGLVQSGTDPLALWHQLVTLDCEIYEVSEASRQLISLSEDDIRRRLISDISPQSRRFISVLAVPRENICEVLLNINRPLQHISQIPFVISFSAHGNSLEFTTKRGFYAAEDWGQWSCANKAEVYFALKDYARKPLYLKLTFDALVTPAHSQTFEFYLNGHKLGRQTYTNYSSNQVLVDISGLTQEANALVLTIPDSATPQSLGINGDPRKLGIGLITLELNDKK